MSDTRPSVKAIFGEALERAPELRASYLDGACRNYPEVRAQVEALLAAYEEADEFMAAPTRGGLPLEDSAEVSEKAGDQIGLYKLLQEIGVGGMGTVYMAEQEKPVRRRVALKIIKLGMDTKQVIGRFEAERQALAMMDHPNIAKVLDAGSTETGRPYFVMELVKGVAINEYCDKTNLSTEQRLALFIAVCQAVQHAHQKGIIHRDLKPGNILVTLHDGIPVPKVIDFGIAKATSQKLTERTVFTEFRSFIGTPEYMSPEQAEMSGLDIDTRSDIYSLGVVLYELLTGTTPFDAKTLRSAAFDELQRIIREDEPDRPSTRVSTMAGKSSISEDTRSLSRSIRGDLDWIVMKALDKDRTRRYDSASDLAKDVQRHLENQPVMAGPPSLSYKLSKFVRRNKAMVVTAILVAFLLISGIVGTTWGMIQASDHAALAAVAQTEAEKQTEEAKAARADESEQREIAEAARAEALEQKELAEQEAVRSQHVTQFLVDTLSFADPEVALTPDITVRALLDRGAEQLGTVIQDEEVEAMIRSTVGRAYHSLGEFEPAERHLRRAIEIYDLRDDVDPEQLYITLWPMAGIVFQQAGGEISSIGGRLVKLGLQMIGADHPELSRTLEIMVSSNFATDHARAFEYFERSKEIATRDLPIGDSLWRMVADDYFICGMTGWLFSFSPHTAEMLSEALTVYRRELPETHPMVTATMEFLVSLYLTDGEYDRAERLIRESIELRSRTHPADHWAIKSSKALLASCLTGQGRFEEAEPLLLDAYEVSKDLPQYHAGTVGQLTHLYQEWGKDELVPSYREELANLLSTTSPPAPLPLADIAFGEEQRGVIEGLYTIQQAVQSQAPQMMARQAGNATPSGSDGPSLQQALDSFLSVRRSDLPNTHPLAPYVARQLCFWGEQWAQVHAETRGTMFDEARTILSEWEDSLPRDLAYALFELGEMERVLGRDDSAEELYWESLQLTERTGEDEWNLAVRRWSLGRLLTRQGRFEEAEPLMTAAHETFTRRNGEMSEESIDCCNTIVAMYDSWGKLEKARPYIVKQLRFAERIANRDNPQADHLNDAAWFLLTCKLEDLRDPERALNYARRAVEKSKGEWPDPMGLVAHALFELGRTGEAVEAQERFIELIPENAPAKSRALERLEEYRAAL